MSRPRPITAGRERAVNLVVLLREAYLALDNLVPARLVARGHEAIRPAHSAVFEYLDETGTTVSRLAERARMTKQAMAELVEHLETHGYVERRPNPSDGRSRLVVPTERGRDVVTIAQAMVPEVEELAERAVGPGRLDRLRADLVAIQRAVEVSDAAAQPAPPAPPSPPEGPRADGPAASRSRRAGTRG
jgi:DNA-binding MarR family transcriptional regulator